MAGGLALLLGTARAAVPPLADPDPRRRVEAVRALGREGDPAAEAALGRALGDRDPVIRAAAIEALARVGGPSAIALVVARFDDEAVPVRRDAIEATRELSRLFPRALPDPLLLRLRLGDAAPEVRAAAIEALASRDDRGAIPLLLRQLDTRGDASRLAAISALGKLHATEAIPPLAHLLHDGPLAEREAAIAALLAIATTGDPSALTPITAALDDPTLRLAAAQALTEMGEQAVPALLLKRELGGMPDTVGAVIDVLGEIGDRRAEPALLEELGRGLVPRARVVETLARLAALAGAEGESALCQRLAPVLAGFITSADPGLRLRIVAGLSPTCESGERALLAASRDGDPAVRLRAIARLREARAPASVARLVALIIEGDAAARVAAAHALDGRGEPSAVAPLVALALHGLDRSGGDLSERAARHAAAKALRGNCDASCERSLLAAIVRAKGAPRADGIRAIGVALPGRGPSEETTQMLAAAATGADEAQAEAALATIDLLAVRALSTAHDLSPAPSANRLLGLTAPLAGIALDLARPVERRRLAVQAAAALDDPARESLMLNALRDPDAAVRAEAAWSLAPASDAARAALEAALADPDGAVRANALASLAEIAPAASRIALLGDRDPAVRANAALTLPSLAGPIQVRALHLAAGDPDPAVRFSALRRLARETPDSLDTALRIAADDPAPLAHRPLTGSSAFAPLTIFVTTPDGRPLADTPVRLDLADGLVKSTRTDGAGAVHLASAPSGRYEIAVSPSVP